MCVCVCGVGGWVGGGLYVCVYVCVWGGFVFGEEIVSVEQ